LPIEVSLFQGGLQITGALDCAFENVSLIATLSVTSCQDEKNRQYQEK
jgi:hypothetical protein